MLMFKKIFFFNQNAAKQKSLGGWCTTDDGRQPPIAIGHLSDLGDLKMQIIKMKTCV